MPSLPDRPNLNHLRKEAKRLLASCKARDPLALERMHVQVPKATRLTRDRDATEPELRLADAQLCLAREYGFGSWPELKRYVDLRAWTHGDPAQKMLAWLRLVYARLSQHKPLARVSR